MQTDNDELLWVSLAGQPQLSQEHGNWDCILNATEPGYAGDIGAIEIWLIDWLIDWLIERYFSMLSLLSVGYFSRRETRADLKCEGKEPSESDKLTIDVICVARMSR